MSSAGETAATVAYQARGVGDSLASYVRQHPLQVALTVGAVTWWMIRGRGESEWYGSADTSWDESEGRSYRDGRSLRNRVGEYASSARDTVGEYASSARETVGEYASTARETVGDYASSARETVGEYAESARDRAMLASEAARRAAGTATSTLDDFVTENPLAVGAIALAVGAAIGMSVPATEMENRTMGDARDRAWERATKAATEIKDNVTKKVEDVAENFVNENILDTLTGAPTEPIGRA